METCPVCEGSGQVESSEETMIRIMKAAQHILFRPRAVTCTFVDSLCEDWKAADTIYDKEQTSLGGP